jgi:MoaA/NifB/PqqE/SkfB family radical SAM enzyme
VQTVVRTTGSIGPCCLVSNLDNIQQTTIKEFWQGKQMVSMRDRLLNSSNPLPECQQCYSLEESLGSSMRTQALADYKFFNAKLYEKLLKHFKYDCTNFPPRLEIHVGNLCNLKCLTCRPSDSSAFLTEDKILKISNHNQSEFQIDDDLLRQNLSAISQHNIEILDLRGGESMLSPVIKKFLDQLPDAFYKNTLLRIQTNGTILDQTWKNILSKFSQVEIMLSIDAHSDHNEYIRFPSKWTDIEQNVEYFQQLAHIKMYVNCTISNINFLVLDKLISWCREKNLYFHYSVLTAPSYYHYQNMPNILLKQGFEKISQFAELDDFKNLPNSVSNNNTQLWQEFCSMITRRDLHRKNNIFSILPEYKSYWTN